MESTIKQIIQAEWVMFQHTQNVGGRASCQDNMPQFYGMRYGQFAAWNEATRLSYLQDLTTAKEAGRNLVAEKYLRMMESTSPAEYEMQKHLIPQLSADQKSLISTICQSMIEETVPLRQQFPLLSQAGRPLYTSEDNSGFTSVQTYQLGELGTYSMETLRALQTHIDNLHSQQRSLPKEILTSTVLYYGYKSLDEAENALKKRIQH